MPGAGLTQPARSAALLAVSAGALASLSWFLATWFVRFELSDEGFFWYGAQRTLRGEMPLLDFNAYDIGRYFYAAAVFRLMHDDGILPARIAAYSLMFPVAAIAVYLIDRANSRPLIQRSVRAVVVAFVVLLWTYPYFKAFDFFACALLLLATYHVLSSPGARTWLLLGATCGLVALIGRNHGLYGAMTSLIALALLRAWHGRAAGSRAVYWLPGAVLGYAPMLCSLVLVDGFLETTLTALQGLVAKGQTNLGLPVPWPWKVDMRRLGVIYSVWKIALGLGFVLLLAFAAAGAVLLALRRRTDDPASKSSAACLCVAVPYLHYAFSRADITHLALAMLPVCIGILALPHTTRLRESARLAGLLAFSLAVLLPVSPIGYYLNPTLHWEAVRVRDTKLVLSRSEAANYNRAVASLKNHLRDGQTFVAMPNMPGLHAAFGMPVPTFGIYVLWPISERQERAELDRLQRARPAMVLLSDHALDDKDQQRFSRLRPALYAWILDNYKREPLPAGADLPTTLEVYVSK